MLRKACLPSCCLTSILVPKASGTLPEEAPSARASVLRRIGQDCAFHHQHVIRLYKSSCEPTCTFTSGPSPPCRDALRAGRCHAFGLLPVLPSSRS